MRDREQKAFQLAHAEASAQLKELQLAQLQEIKDMQMSKFQEIKEMQLAQLQEKLAKQEQSWKNKNKRLSR